MLTTPEEQFQYISDPMRLELFGHAAIRVIRPGDLVADVGCGFGVLGLLCLRAGAARVWGIDNTDAIEIARETMTRAGLGDRYACIRERSFRAVLPEPVDVIVCDHVGYFGIDYGIITMLGDARHRMLKPGGRIVPGRIKLMLAGVSSATCRAKAEAWAAPEIPSEFHWLREYGVNSKHARKLEPGEIVTEPVVLGTVDLNQDSPDLLAFNASLVADTDGALDGLAGWFDCELAEGVSMTNSPLSDTAIDRPQAFLPFDRPIAVVAGDTIEVSLSIRHDSELIVWLARNARTGQRQKQSTWTSQVLSKADLARHPAKPLTLGRAALARQVVSGYVDGKRSTREIEDAVLRDHPALFPSSEEISRFVRRELSRSAG